FRQVAFDAAIRCRMAARRNQLLNPARVALVTYLCISRICCFSPQGMVRVMAGFASQSAPAFVEAARLPQPVRRTYRFELVTAPCCPRIIEAQFEIFQRLPRPERKRPTIESLDQRWKRI